MEIDLSKVDALIEKRGTERRVLMSLLLDVQEEFGYLPEPAISHIAEKFGVPPVLIYRDARFYDAFTLHPRGQHLITVCEGTACHVRGSKPFAEEVEKALGVAMWDTTEDGQYTLEKVNCPGACAAGPVMGVDGKYFGRMTASKIQQVLQACAAGKEAAGHD